MIAVGVARPRAQGQAITSTAVMLSRARVRSPVAINHAARVTSARPTTAGTK